MQRTEVAYLVCEKVVADRHSPSLLIGEARAQNPCGLPKTGTSALQRSMFDLRAYLERANIYYPPALNVTTQRLVGGLTMGLIPRWSPLFSRKSTPGQTVVWSAEGFSRSFPRLMMVRPPGLRLKSLPSSHSERNSCWSLYKQCLINPVSYSVSYYGQNIPFEDFIELPYTPASLPTFLNFQDLSSLFQGEVTVLDYDALDLGKLNGSPEWPCLRGRRLRASTPLSPCRRRTRPAAYATLAGLARVMRR